MAAAVEGNNPLPSSACELLLPLLRMVMSVAKLGPAHEHVLHVIEAQCDSPEPQPLDDLLTLLHYVSDRFPATVSRTTPLLTQLCRVVTGTHGAQVWQAAVAGLYSPNPHVRGGCLEALQCVP